MKIESLTEEKAAAWDAFVRADPKGTFFHLSAWKRVAEQAFGFKTYYLFAEEAGEICGVLPLACVRRPLFGKALISTPLCVYGGAVGRCDELEEAARKKAEALDVAYLEIRSQEKIATDWPTSDIFFAFRRALSSDHDENLKAIPRKQRAEVRRGMDAGLRVTHDRNLDLFYRIYATSVRNLGTPVYPRNYLKVLMETFGDACEITTVTDDGRPLSSVLTFYYKDQALPYYGGGLPEARAHSAYPFMYWQVMKRAAEKGYRIFDYGRSMKGTGAFAFKKNFGFEPQPLAYRYHLVKADRMPDLSPNNPRNEMLCRIWKRFPLPLANNLGPVLYPVVV